MVDTFEQLLGGEELYHYHSKLMMKEVIIYDEQMRMVRLLVILKTMTCSDSDCSMLMTISTRPRQGVSMCGTKTMDTGKPVNQ